MITFEDCDSCGTQIADRHPGDGVLQTANVAVTLPTENRREYEQSDYLLCSECRRKLVDWIEGCDETETRADLVDLEVAAENMVEMGSELMTAGERLDVLARGESDE